MAVGDVKVDQDLIASSSGWGVQPPSGDTWQLRDWAINAHEPGRAGGWKMRIEMWDGNQAAIYKPSTTQAVIHVTGTVMTNAIYVRFLNEYTGSRNISYSCMEVD